MTTTTTKTCLTADEIEKQWEVDSKLDKAELIKHSLEIDYIHSKYLKIYRQCKEQYVRLNALYNQAVFDARKYYSGKAESDVYKKDPFDEKVLRTDLDKYITVDEKVVKASAALEKSKLKIELVESILKQISYRSLNIKNLIEYIKFLSGER